MLYVLLAPEWLRAENPSVKPIQGLFSQEQIEDYNSKGYNIYFYPNYPSIPPTSNEFLKGSDIDVFEWVFIDLDMKHGAYESKEAFLALLGDFPLLPSKIIDSGNGIHAYWKVSDLDAMNYLKLQRRLMRHFNTDDAVAKIKQLMRVPNTVNTKHKDGFKLCELLLNEDLSYTCEDLDKVLPQITMEDEQYCKRHFSTVYNSNDPSLTNDLSIDDKLPLKFAKLLDSNQEVKSIWSGDLKGDRSTSDFRLGHIMFASGFTKEEAASVLINSAKALARAPVHRINYATNIIDKIWTFEIAEDKNALNLSSSVRDILNRSGDAIKGTRFACWDYLDGTLHGFRLGQVVGLVAGSGVGKTAIALNMFMGFVQNNPDYDHFFVPLEQPADEIADRWKTMCQGQEHLYEKVQIISNYDASGNFRHLSLQEIRDYLSRYQETTKRKIGCVVIDHIGALKKKTKDGENQGLMDICHEMKAFAIQTNTLLVMQSQAPREKAGIGDLELNKDAAYGTLFFESYCDHLITLWQPLKRCYPDGAPTITAFKFCKIRHKKQDKDRIKEDVCYSLIFDSNTELLREMTQDETIGLPFWVAQATNKRKADRKTDVVTYQSAKVGANAEPNSNKKIIGITAVKGLH